MDEFASVSFAEIKAFREKYQQSTLSQAAARAASRASLQDICYNNQQAAGLSQKFSVNIPTMEACNQKASGRCWIFAALNILREKLAKEKNLPDFELSQSYFSFYDHLEKANTFYMHILETAEETLGSRYVSMLLSDPIGDGGWWEYFVGLCEKYGAVPKEAMPETYQSQHSEHMNTLLSMQLRKDALALRKAAAQHTSPEHLQAMKESMLSRVYNVLAVCLGTPPEVFDFEYVDKDGTYHADRSLTPHGFYDRYIGRNLSDIVSILNAPIPSAPFYGVYYTQGEESIYGAYQSRRLNLPMEEFKAAVIRQLQAGEPTWFVCDCDYYGSKEAGIWDTALYDYESLLSLDLALQKGDLLDLRQCTLNHAMVLTGVNLVDGKPDKWKVQNSWGTDCAQKGYFVISDSWFDRYVFTASIDKKYLTPEQRSCFDREATMLPPWNVLG